VDILIVQRGGRASGEAYAVLSHPAEMDAAMRKNKAYMGSRYVEVFEARKMDYYRAIGDMFGGGGGGGGRGPPGSPGGRDRSRSPPPRRAPAGDGTSCVVKMRGLPFSATGDEISAFFADPNLGIAAPPGPDK
jgi:heterogeneous nuclear ribonucleoprotein F/H